MEMNDLTIQQLSAGAIGHVWTPEDHAALCHHIAEVERTALELHELRMAAQRRLDARAILEWRDGGR